MLAEHDVKPVGAAAGADQASVAESTQSASNKAVMSVPTHCAYLAVNITVLPAVLTFSGQSLHARTLYYDLYQS